MWRHRDDGPSRFGKLRLDKNERVSPFPPSTWEAIVSELCPEYVTAYPEVSELYKELANFHGIDQRQLTVTAGLDGGIRNCFDLFVSASSRVVTLEPTFKMVDIYSGLYNVKRVPIRFDSNLKLNLEQLLDSVDLEPSLIIIANPNSPTGTTIAEQNLIKLIGKAEQRSIPVLIDEAYHGFSSSTSLPLVNEFSNLIVGRTFSKSFGLAGCRVGYLVSNPTLTERLLKFRAMYEVNAIGAFIAVAMLRRYQEVETYCTEVITARNKMCELAANCGIGAINTEANFIHLDFGKNKLCVLEYLRDSNVLVRDEVNIPELARYLRVSVGPMSLMEPLAKALKKYGK